MKKSTEKSTDELYKIRDKFLEFAESLNDKCLKYEDYLNNLNNRFERIYDKLKKKNLLNEKISKSFDNIFSNIKEFIEETNKLKKNADELYERIKSSGNVVKFIDLLYSAQNLMNNDFFNNNIIQNLNTDISKIDGELKDLNLEKEDNPNEEK